MATGNGSVCFALLLVSAGTVVAFGTLLGIYETRSNDHSMEPTIFAGDWLVGESLPKTGQLLRGDLLELNNGWPGIVRVVGLPGDRIQIKKGQLIRNGTAVPKPHRKVYSGSDGDFPLPSNVYADDSLRLTHEHAYGGGISAGQEYVVPEGALFVLNDNREQLRDSRTAGPIPRESVVAKMLAAYRLAPHWSSLPRIVR